MQDETSHMSLQVILLRGSGLSFWALYFTFLPVINDHIFHALRINGRTNFSVKIIWQTSFNHPMVDL